MITSIDLFAGGGGASEGIRRATGRAPVIAVNHDPDAIKMHAANHPGTMHLCESVFDVTPFAPKGQLDLLWASPDCTHFSRAKGGKPVSRHIRSLAWIVERWAKAAMPTVICLENVPEFQSWGPLDNKNRPIKSRRGETFLEFIQSIKNRGYDVEWRELVACDYGAPTSRRRLFIIARCDGEDIVWPEPTHGPGRELPYHTAAECIDWNVPALSIFATPQEARAWAKKHGTGTPRRPLAEATMRRIAEGVRRFVLENPTPFLLNLTHGGRLEPLQEPFRTITCANRGEKALVTPTLIQTGYGERKGQSPRVLNLHEPLGTVVASGAKHALVSTFITKYYGEGYGASMDDPMPTVTTRDRFGLVRAFLTKFYGTSTGSDLSDPMHTITSGGKRGGGHLGLVTVRGQQYAISDITLRMLQPRELARAQGFGDEYILTGSKSQQVARIGNSVPPPVVEAIVNAQFGGPRQIDRVTVAA